MAFTGYFTLDGTEIANTNRVAAHLGQTTPTRDVWAVLENDFTELVEDPPGSGLYIPSLPLAAPGLYVPTGLTEDADNPGLYYSEDYDNACALIEDPDHPGFYQIPDDSVQVGNMWSVPNGARQWTEGMFEFDGRCWDDTNTCSNCQVSVLNQDSWASLPDLLGDLVYRPEIAPWYTSRVPESGEFMGVWVMQVDGLDATPVDRTVTEMAGDGASASRPRARSRKVTFDALLIACTDAGLAYGMDWLTCQLQLASANPGVTLRYLSANPTGSIGDVSEMIREVHNCVLTQEPQIKDQTMDHIYRVSFELTALRPHAYWPSVDLDVDWSDISVQAINWVHAADCVKPSDCGIPVLLSADCVPEVLGVVSSPPPVCGGCLPVCSIEQYTFEVPTRDFPLRCRETAVSLTFKNTGAGALTLQAYWRVAGTDERCDDNQYPVQISGLPATASLTLDAVNGTYSALIDDVTYRPVGIVGTPNGAPWQPTIIDRATAWEFVVMAGPDAEFEVSMSFADRTP